MKLKSLILERFGPFCEYQLDFPTDDKACTLLVGQNNTGKSSIIRALRLLDNAMKFAKQSSQPISGFLHRKDTEDIEIGRLIHNLEGNTASITGILDTGRIIRVELNNAENTISFQLPRYAHRSMASLFGFIPQLGQLAEREYLVTRDHLLRNINSTLAPRHMRNHVYQLLSREECNLLRNIVNDSWIGIELQNLELDLPTNILLWLYKENGIFNEIAWAGQGMQIWIQIITHLVRLSDRSILVLDEPEIFLHPKKQHDLIQILREYHSGSIIIATHSSELMNNVDISHIIHVQKGVPITKMLTISDRNELEKLRGNIGSSFNLIASQFEDVEILLATEYQLDYDIIHQLALAFGFTAKTQGVRISGFNNWQGSVDYKKAYSMFFGKQVKCSLLLDRDYYPQDYLTTIQDSLSQNKVTTVFTPGKEIENLFLEEKFLKSLIPNDNFEDLEEFLDSIYQTEYDICFPKYVEFQHQYSSGCKSRTYSSVHRDLKPSFDARWNDKDKRHNLISGKRVLAQIRVFFKEKYNMPLPTSFLTKHLGETGNNTARKLVTALFQ